MKKIIDLAVIICISFCLAAIFMNMSVKLFVSVVFPIVGVLFKYGSKCRGAETDGYRLEVGCTFLMLLGLAGGIAHTNNLLSFFNVFYFIAIYTSIVLDLWNIFPAMTKNMAASIERKKMWDHLL